MSDEWVWTVRDGDPHIEECKTPFGTLIRINRANPPHPSEGVMDAIVEWLKGEGREEPSDD